MEKSAAEGESPVHEIIYHPSSILSRAGPVKPCLNLAAPSAKAKYSWETDSEPVPWGKGEKHPDEGSETVSETGRLQTVGGILYPDGVPFV